MIQSHFGITHAPFTQSEPPLLTRQKEVLQELQVHCHHRGFCLVAGQPGTGKTVLRKAFAQAKSRFGFRLTHYSVMGNHLHAIVEANDQRALTRGMTGLLVRMARALNKHWSRRGRVFADHFHQHQLTKPREVRNALAYVLNNARHHNYRIDTLDYYASGLWFDGWAIHIEITGSASSWPPSVAPPTTWLLRKGWRPHGRIRTFETPGQAA